MLYAQPLATHLLLSSYALGTLCKQTCAFSILYAHLAVLHIVHAHFHVPDKLYTQSTIGVPNVAAQLHTWCILYVNICASHTICIPLSASHIMYTTHIEFFHTVWAQCSKKVSCYRKVRIYRYALRILYEWVYVLHKGNSHACTSTLHEQSYVQTTVCTIQYS